MKRDMDLIRKILLDLENNPPEKLINRLYIVGYSREQINYHLYLMMQAGFIEGYDVTTHNSFGTEIRPQQLTWAGHDFLDACRDEGIWVKAKEKLKSIGGEVPIEVFKVLLIEIMKKQLGV